MSQPMKTPQTIEHFSARIDSVPSTPMLIYRDEFEEIYIKQDQPARKTLPQRQCLRCTYTWWPRQSKPPRRCARCKSPYWNRPRRKSATVTPVTAAHSPSIVAKDTPSTLSSSPAPKSGPDQSALRLFTVLKEMKANNVPWAERLERVRQEFGVELTKDQVKTLGR